MPKDNSAHTVRRGNEILDVENGEAILSRFDGCLTIEYPNDQRETIRLIDHTPLFFKIGKDWEGDGRKIAAIPKGCFIGIARRERERTGPAPVEPEMCDDENFFAHFFFHDADAERKDVGGFQGHSMELTDRSLDLQGTCIYDDSEKGSLFVGSAPRIEERNDIAWVRVGEEKPDGWGENFNPANHSLPEILGGLEGWFFVRLYNDDVEMLDSGQFRYMKNLRKILIDGKEYTERTILAPPDGGYSQTTIKFVDSGDEVICPVLNGGQDYARVSSKGVVIVEPCPERDYLSVCLNVPNVPVECVVHLPRIWWRLENSVDAAEQWRDKLIDMTRAEFREYADADAAIVLRLPPCVREAVAGFGNEIDRNIPILRCPDGRTRRIRLRFRDFSDYDEVRRRLFDDALFRIRCNDVTVQPIRVVSDTVPAIEYFRADRRSIIFGETVSLAWATRAAEAPDVEVRIEPGGGPAPPHGTCAVAPAASMLYTLSLSAGGRVVAESTVAVAVRCPVAAAIRPQVKRRGGGWRVGKGFSLSELKAARVDSARAVDEAIRIDKRRRSKHSINITDLAEQFDDR